MKIEVKELSPMLWKEAETLFGSNGAGGGCFCMFWRVEKGEKWEELKGASAKKRFRKGIEAGRILGALAFVDGQPVGWCTFGPRRTFPRLDRAPSFRCDDAEKVWSIPCFFVRAGFREKGVGRALLAQALRSIRRRGGKVIEGYPAKAPKSGRYVPAFSWTGTTSLFAKAGFAAVGKRDGGKQRMRL